MKVSDDEFLAASLAIGSVRLQRWLKGLEREPSLNGSEASAMAIIVELGAVTPIRIANLEMVKKSSITRILARLEQRDLIVRSENPTDKRSMLISPTETGKSEWFNYQLAKVAPLASRISNLTDTERQVVKDFTGIFDKLSAWYSEDSKKY
ncbi:MarR family transcriptional regulator [Sphingomonadaceae bacterium]|nr:MarR family transcriptional regulator [Sphingomonadaceae bacterium]